MKIAVFCLAGLLSTAVCGASPPVSGGFLTGPDSALYVYWFHSGCHAYEQGIDGSLTQFPLSPGDVSGRFCVIQKASFPIFSLVTDFRIKIYPRDDYPQFPGDQFSPYGYLVFGDDADGAPVQPPLIKGIGQLGDGESGSDQWASNGMMLPCIAGGECWFGFEWADSTNTAPQIEMALFDGARAFNKMGHYETDSYLWDDFRYAPIFRTRFLSITDCDSMVTPGWRRPADTTDVPDGFQVTCYYAADVSAPVFVTADDTLCYRLPADNPDSVRIQSCPAGQADEEALMLRYVSSRRLPLEVYREGEENITCSGSVDFVINNTGDIALSLVLGNDPSKVEIPVRHLYVEAFSEVTLSVVLSAEYGPEANIPLVIRDVAGDYYPYWVNLAGYPDEPTGIDDDADRYWAANDASVRVAPNPFRAYVDIRMSAPGMVEVFNIVGQKVVELSTGEDLTIRWDGRDMSGSRVATGVYFARMYGERGRAIFRQIIYLHK